MIVPIEQVISPDEEANQWEVPKMMQVLQKQGQIEPLQVKVYHDGKYAVFPFNYDVEILAAAKALGWKDILITIVKRYEQ
tara:strand:- start:195 stop:434 length:240 start_codon:yes stop_codon:yes gene_type:complete